MCIRDRYVPADDLTDPSPATTFGHLDATVVLSRDIASLGICLLYTSDAADERSSVDLGGRRIIKKKKNIEI